MAKFRANPAALKIAIVASRFQSVLVVSAYRVKRLRHAHEANPRGNPGTPGEYKISAWPRPRGRKNLKPIQRQQIHLWDMVMLAIKSADPLDRQQAEEDTKGTAYYVRDILSMIAFGSYISWPGFGPFPDGSASGPVPLPRNQRAQRAALALANPQKVNVVQNTTDEDVSGKPGKTFTLAFSATNPLLLVWDRDPVRIEVPVKRIRKKKDHGKKPWFEDEPVFANASTGGGTSWSFQMPDTGPTGGAPSWYALAQLGTDSKTGVSFSTTARRIKLIAVIVDFIKSPNVTEANLQFPDADFYPGDPGRRATEDGWPQCNLMVVDYDDFVGGSAPDGPFTRHSYLVNLSDGAPDYPFPRQYFYQGAFHQLAKGQWSFGLNIQTLAIHGPGGIRVRVYHGTADFTITGGYHVEALGGTKSYDSSAMFDALPTGERHVTWLVSETGIDATLVEDLP